MLKDANATFENFKKKLETIKSNITFKKEPRI